MNSTLIVIPVYNEAGSLPAVLDELAAMDWPVAVEIVAVDGGSTDGTPDLALAAGVNTRGQPSLLAKERSARGRSRRSVLEAVLTYFLTAGQSPQDAPRFHPPRHRRLLDPQRQRRRPPL